MSKQLLKSDILKILSKEISGGSNKRVAFESAEVPKTFFGLGGAEKDGAEKPPAPFFMTSEGCFKSTQASEKIIDYFENERSFKKSKHFKNRKELDNAILIVRQNLTNPECNGEQLAKMGDADLKYSMKYGDDAPKIKVKSAPPKPKPKLKILPKSAPAKPKPKLKILPKSAPAKPKPKLKILPASEKTAPAKPKPKLKILPKSAPAKPKPKLKILPASLPPPPPFMPLPSSASVPPPLPIKLTKPYKPQASNRTEWQNHVAKFRKEHPEVAPKDVMREASLTYKKTAPPKKKSAPPKKKSAPSKKKSVPSHVMPDGAVHSGKTHTKDSVVLKPAPKKKRAKSAWMLFVDKFRKDHPEISGKAVMKEAAIAYKKTPSPKESAPSPKKSAPSPKESAPHPRDMDKDGRKSREPTPYLPDSDGPNTVSSKDEKTILADVLDSLDNFNAQFEKIANSNLAKSFKQQEFSKIMDAAFGFYEKVILSLKNKVDILSFMRMEDSFKHVQDAFTEGYKNLRNGYDQVEFSDYEDDENIQRIIDDEILIDEHVLDRVSKMRDDLIEQERAVPIKPITENVKLSANNDILPEELQIDMVPPEIEEQDPSPPPSPKPSLIEKEFEEEFKKRQREKDPDMSPPVYGDSTLQYSRKASLYPSNLLAEENSIQPTSIANTNMMAPRLAPARKPRLKINPKSAPSKRKPRLKINPKSAPEKKQSLNLRIYNKFHELMKKNGATDRAVVDEIWFKNEDAYVEMLMDVVAKGGGDVHDKEHYYNAFSNLGELMCRGAGMCGGEHVMSGPGNTAYRLKHATPAFDRAVYDTKNNPYGIGKTHSDAVPRLPKPSAPESGPESAPSKFKADPLSGRFVDDDGIDMTDLSDPRAWGKTFENIAKGTYEGVKSIYKLFSPATWLP